MVFRRLEDSLQQLRSEYLAVPRLSLAPTCSWARRRPHHISHEHGEVQRSDDQHEEREKQVAGCRVQRVSLLRAAAGPGYPLPTSQHDADQQATTSRVAAASSRRASCP